MTQPFRTLIINPGSTSTKIAVFDDEEVLLSTTVEHPVDELATYECIADQFEMRQALIIHTLEEKGVALTSLAAIVGRGGLLRPMDGGTYEVSTKMLDEIRKAERGEHASNLGALIAHAIASQIGCPAYIVDPVVVDELNDLARFTGHPKFSRVSIFHALNQKRTARIVAEKIGKKYDESNIIIAHMGGGTSVAIHHNGRVVDVNNALDGDGPFSQERTGSLPAGQLVGLCFSGDYSEKEIRLMIKGKGGMVAYQNTSDLRVTEERIAQNSIEAEKAHSAMAYQVAKEIGQLATVVSGRVDAIGLTGGVAYSESFVNKIRQRVQFIAEVFVIPGENEMDALRDGALRILRDEEVALVY